VGNAGACELGLALKMNMCLQTLDLVRKNAFFYSDFFVVSLVRVFSMSYVVIGCFV
jgi:hypothetical protein